MTLSKLAQLANASVSTVSKAFSGKGDISDSMREHIFAVAREHGCFQQFYHMPYDRPVVAVIIPEAISQTYIRYVEALRKELEKNEYTMLLSISNFDPQMKQELARYYFEHGKVDGLVVIGGGVTLPPNTHTTLIAVGGEESAVCIKTPLLPGLSECVRQLYALGHRRIAYIGEPLVESKREKLVTVMEEMGMEICPDHMICSSHRFEDAGRDGVRRIRQSPHPKPTAILGGYGYVTKGILAELESMGVCVPDEVSVVTLNKDGIDPVYGGNVACVVSDIEQECQWIVRLLNDRVGTSRPNAPCTVELPTRFVTGDTVAKAKS